MYRKEDEIHNIGKVISSEHDTLISLPNETLLFETAVTLDVAKVFFGNISSIITTVSVLIHTSSVFVRQPRAVKSIASAGVAKLGNEWIVFCSLGIDKPYNNKQQ
jgi:hypothetical protein